MFNKARVVTTRTECVRLHAGTRAPRVLVVAPGITSRGGIVSVVRLHMSMPLWSEMQCDLLETYDDKGCLAKFRAAFRAYLQAPFKLLRTDLVHLHLAGELSLLRKLPIAALARLLRKPLLVHVHASSPESLFSATPAWAVRFVLLRADRVIALSPGWASIIEARVPGARTCVVPNPVQTFAAASDPKAREPVVLFVGRLEPRKGYKTLLQAAVRVLECYPDTQFWFAGHGELDVATAEAARLGIQSSVRLLGWTDPERTAELYQRARVFCLPSHNEGVPMSVLEAMSHGTPVVCTAVGGLPEFVVNGETGLFAEVGDPESTAKKIICFLSDPSKASSVGRAGLQSIQDRCGLEMVERSLREIYFDVVTRRASRGPSQFTVSL